MKTLKLFLPAIMALAAVSCGKAISSPDGSLKAAVDNQTITLTCDGVTVFESIHVGLITEASNLDSLMTLKKVSGKKKVTADYTMVAGKRSHCTNAAKERTYTYENPRGEVLKVIVRVYNDGIAIRYSTAEGVKVVEDRTSYHIAEGVNRWFMPMDHGYEQPFPYAVDGRSLRGRPFARTLENGWGYPALLEPAEGTFALIAEADLRRNDSGSYLNNIDNREEYVVTLTGAASFCDGLSPWRLAIVGSLADIVESTLVTDLSTPSQIKDTDWIKPGVSSWIYWAYNHGSKDFELIKEFIDLAVEMKWPYCLVDWEWPQMEGGYDLNDVMAYAKKKGIGINLWYNSGTSWIGPGSPQPEDRLNTPEGREAEFAWLESLGVGGVKVDFFSPDDPEIVNYYLDILEDAARHHLMVDFHGCTIPRGWQRTWPNMMSMEAIYGAEWYNNGPFFTPAAAVHNATVPFTRNVIGPMDYTPATFTDSQFPHITTNAHEYALAFLFESGLQHMADRPAGYQALPAKARQIYSEMPSAWDDTKLLEGYPGVSAVIARRSGNRWYIAGISGLAEPAVISFSLARLGVDVQSATLICDGEEDRDLQVTEIAVVDGKVTIPCRARGGFTIVIE